MRQRVHRKPLIGQLEQGSIINCCLAEEYKGKEVYGIIITPRCDISNEKVTSFHYLPIVSYYDWLRINFWEIFRRKIGIDLNSKMKGILKSKNISTNIVDSFTPGEIRKTFLERYTKKKDKDKFSETSIDLEKLLGTPSQNPSDEDFYYFFNRFDKTAKSILNEIKQNKRNEFYLIEDFTDREEKSYFVILSREVRRISFEIGLRIACGLNMLELSSDDYRVSDINPKAKSGFIMAHAVLESPILEHLIQHFNQNFARIGVQDHPRSIIETLFCES